MSRSAEAARGGACRRFRLRGCLEAEPVQSGRGESVCSQDRRRRVKKGSRVAQLAGVVADWLSLSLAVPGQWPTGPNGRQGMARHSPAASGRRFFGVRSSSAAAGVPSAFQTSPRRWRCRVGRSLHPGRRLPFEPGLALGNRFEESGPEGSTPQLSRGPGKKLLLGFACQSGGIS